MRHNLGRVVATAAVAASVPHHQITALLDRHAAGDWGDLSEATCTGDGRIISKQQGHAEAATAAFLHSGIQCL
jgi:hypothetical protein